MDPRWPGDTESQGRPVPAAANHRVAAFSGALGDVRWLTEDPDAHLGPKLDSWLAGHPDVRVEDRRTEADGSWHLAARVERATRARDRRATAISLIGSFAEDVLFVEEERGASTRYVVLTGQPARDGLRAHGHVVVLTIVV